MGATDKLHSVLIIIVLFSQPFINSTDGEYIHMYEETRLTFGTCDLNNKARLNSGVSLQDCVRDCLLRSWCQYAIYRFTAGICALTENDPGNLADSYPLCAYTKRSDWNATSLGRCSTNHCNHTQLCDPDKSNELSPCTVIACGEPRSIAHASYRPPNKVTDIGLKVAYTCNHGYGPLGNPSIICQEDGTWSNTDFQCKASCPPPRKLDNSEVTRVDHSIYGLYGYETVLHIECKPGFVKMTASEITSTCVANKRWNVTVIPCCKPGYGFLVRNAWDRSCYILHDDVSLDTRQEMADFCKNESNTSALFFGTNLKQDLQITNTIFQKTNTTLNYIMASVNTTNLKKDLLKCIDKSEVQIHDEQRNKNIEPLIPAACNVSGLPYANLTACLSESGINLTGHYNFRLADVKTRLNLISGLNVSRFSNYDELYAELQNQTIDHRDLTTKTYTELANIIRNNTFLMPNCTNDLQYWDEGHPNHKGDCVLTGPLSNFTLINVSCNITEKVPANLTVGFVCWESKRSIQ